MSACDERCKSCGGCRNSFKCRHADFVHKYCTCPASTGNTIPPESILIEAERLTTKDRAAEHGDFTQNCRDAATIAKALYDIDITPKNVAQILVALKHARAKQNPASRDNRVDALGYQRLEFESDWTTP